MKLTDYEAVSIPHTGDKHSPVKPRQLVCYRNVIRSWTQRDNPIIGKTDVHKAMFAKELKWEKVADYALVAETPEPKEKPSFFRKRIRHEY